MILGVSQRSIGNIKIYLQPILILGSKHEANVTMVRRNSKFDFFQNLINIFLSMGVVSIEIFNNFLRALDSTWNFYYEGWIHTNSLENSLLKLVFFHGLRIYIYMSRIAESYGLAYIFIYITWITNIERDYWVSTVTVNASSSFPFKSYLWMGLKRNIQDFLDFLVAL